MLISPFNEELTLVCVRVKCQFFHPVIVPYVCVYEAGVKPIY